MSAEMLLEKLLAMAGELALAKAEVAAVKAELEKCKAESLAALAAAASALASPSTPETTLEEMLAHKIELCALKPAWERVCAEVRRVEQCGGSVREAALLDARRAVEIQRKADAHHDRALNALSCLSYGDAAYRRIDRFSDVTRRSVGQRPLSQEELAELEAVEAEIAAAKAA